MKKHRGWLLLAFVAAFCAGAVWLTWQVTAEYPSLGEPVSYAVNQVEGFDLTIEEPTWSPFKGYTVRWCVEMDSEEVYRFAKDADAPEPVYLERCVDGQWFRLGYSQDAFSFNTISFALGGEESHRFEGSLVQKYQAYGTRLESGQYRVVLELNAADGTPCYLAAEFPIA